MKTQWFKQAGFLFSAAILVLSLAGGNSPPAAQAAAPEHAAILPQDAQEALPPLLNITAIAAGYAHTCARTAGGGVKCWGANFYGQLGDGTTFDRHTPVDVSGLASGVSAIAAGYAHTCALTSGGEVKCWGWNRNGQLGDGTTTNRLTPVNVSGLASGVSAIAAGVYHTCALTAEGGVKCWGRNGGGQLGDGTAIERHMPVNVSGLASGVSAIVAGEQHTCALTAEGGVKCWGGNGYGQLGDGTPTNRYTPIDVSGLASGVSDITAGYQHTCALTAEGGVKCWGRNDTGQLGDGTAYNSRLTPVNVSGLASGVDAIAAGQSHTCARTVGGGVKCWGSNWEGELGDGTTTNRYTPIDVSGLASGVSAIAAGGWHTCALTAEGGVKCWGWNYHGQLGDGTTTKRLTPVDVVDPILLTKSYRSDSAYDGYILETSEFSNMGGLFNSTAETFKVGDTQLDKQFRSILSFDTSELPDNAVIVSAELKIQKQGLVGTDPFTTHQPLKVDIRTSYFGTSILLKAGDFNAPGNKVPGSFGNVPSTGWYSAPLSYRHFPFINLSGTTQFRLRFMLDDNDDMSADYMLFYSGNAGTASNRPLLVIQYYVP